MGKDAGLQSELCIEWCRDMRTKQEAGIVSREPNRAGGVPGHAR